MKLATDATLDASTQTAIAEAYGLGEPLAAVFVARGAMGAVNRLSTNLKGENRNWTIKRSYWNHFTEKDIAREVDFTRRCESVGVPAPNSVQRVDSGGYVLTLNEHLDGGTLYRVLEWVDGEVGRSDDIRTISPIAEWMARIHKLAVDPAGFTIDPWFIRVTHDWDELADRLAPHAQDIADVLRARRSEVQEITDLVNTTEHSGEVWCHTDIGASNLIWSDRGPQLIDWENSGPLVPHQELGCRVRSMGPGGKAGYEAYRRAGGPAEITDITHLASSVAVHLNYLGVQAELLLDDEHVEQHEFARAEVTGAAQDLPSLGVLEQLIKNLSA